MLEVLDLSTLDDQLRYNDLLTIVGQKRPYDTLTFFKNFSSGFDKLVCVVYKDLDSLFLLPGYLRPIPGYEAYLDFISPYGYSGPITTSNVTDDFLARAWSEIERYFKSTNTISCFLRFSLDAQLNGFSGCIKPTMKNIKGRIISEGEQWTAYDRKVRKNVNKALRENLSYKIIFGHEMNVSDFEEFHFIYNDTMVRNNAQDAYFYTLENFKDYATTCGNLCAFIFVSDETRVLSTEMVLISDHSIYSFLGGTLSDGFEKRPNDYLKYELINWARKENIAYFVLGGGYGEEDGIFKYKKSFFPDDVVDYYTGRWILVSEAYDLITETSKSEYIGKNGDSEEVHSKDFFPDYRKYINLARK